MAGARERNGSAVWLRDAGEAGVPPDVRTVSR
jgi:hypothetical protein